jgi:hypothetical protein
MMGNKLSHVLLDMGFFSALGTSEHPGLCEEECHVKCGAPNRICNNNGVTVIYDEVGRPWIIHNSRITKEVRAALVEFELEHGAYVPHSNDMGRFVHRFVLCDWDKENKKIS